MRFLVDENLPSDVSEVLRAAGHDVVDVAGSDIRGMPDAEVWSRANTEGRVLVTRDLDFPLLTTTKPPGLVLLRVPDSYGRTLIAETVRTLLEDRSADDLIGHIAVVSPGRVRMRRL